MEVQRIARGRISVIIPCYNAGRFIDACLERICSETYQDHEIVCVDDGSGDDTPQRLLEWSTRDDRIRVISKQNGGLPQARRSGFLASSGEYIAFLDCDDWFEDDALERMKACLDLTQADIVSCDVTFEYEGNEGKRHVQRARRSGFFTTEEAVRAIYNRTAVFQYAWNKLYRRSAINPDFFPTPSCMGEDYFTVIRTVRDGEATVYHLSAPLHHYLQQGSSMCKAGFSDAHIAAFDLFKVEEKRSIDRYPVLVDSINSYTSIEMLWLLLPMARNGNKNEEIMQEAKRRFRSHLIKLLLSSSIGVPEKGAILLTSISPTLLLNVYKKLSRW